MNTTDKAIVTIEGLSETIRQLRAEIAIQHEEKNRLYNRAETAEMDARIAEEQLLVLATELAAVKAERDEALRQNAEAAPLMDAYRDLVVAWHAYDKAQPAQGLFEQLETITNRVALNNAGVAFLKKHEALKAERDKLRDELQYARYFSVEKFEALEAERDALRAALKRVRNLANNGNLSAEAACLEIGIVAHDALDEGGA